jgi:phage nucleotide-binding protein
LANADLSSLVMPPEAPPNPQKLTRDNLGGLKVTPVQDTQNTFNILIYGEPGVGKTVLSGSAAAVPEMQPVLLVDMEGGTMSLRNTYPNVDTVRVKGWADMQKLYNALHDKEVEYKTVILDSLTEIQKFSMYGIMREVVAADNSRDPDVPSIREWGKNLEQIRLLVRAFRDLPINVIFTALAMKEKDARTGLTLTRPSLTGKLGSEVAAFLDIVVYYYVKNVEGETKRFLLTSGTEKEIAKDRSGRLPIVVESPTMELLHSLITTNNK